MLVDLFYLLVGFIFLLKGADILVDGSSSVARKLGISSFVIGLTVVAFGTSMPELVISTMAGLRGSSGIALGNIIGSNITNTLLILGISAVITPLLVKRATVNKEIPFSLLAVLAVGFLANDFLIDHTSPDGLTRIDGLVLILFFSIFIYYTFGITKSKDNIFQKTVGGIKGEEVKTFGSAKSIVMIVAGLAALILGGQLLVNGAVGIAYAFGLSEALIGLTVVAVGTSLPELAASIVAARKGKTDIAVGNVVGSNIFNLLWVLGFSAVIASIGYNPMLNVDMLILIAATILLLFLIYAGRRNILGRGEGAVLIGIYVCYLVFLLWRG